MKWYSLDRILEKGCDYNFIVSGRGPGKSTAIVNHLIDAFADEGAQFVRISRYDWEVSARLMTAWFNEVNIAHLWDRLDNDELKIVYKSGVWYIENASGARTSMGYSMTLNNQDIFKSSSYDRVTNIVVEEFAMMDERSYIRGEIELFLSAVSTIVRNRQNVKVWFIGNTLTKHNPYFDFFGINVDRLGITPGTIRTFRCAGFEGMGATVAFEYANMSHEDISEISPLMRIGGNITATSGLYAVQPSVAEYKSRTKSLLDEDYNPVFPDLDGIYLGNGEFAAVRVTRLPRYDDLPLLVISKKDVGVIDLVGGRYLNLSGASNPTYEFDGHTFYLNTVSPYRLWADTVRMRRLRERNARCVHAFQTDEMRWKWTNFIDAYGYQMGEI